MSIILILAGFSCKESSKIGQKYNKQLVTEPCIDTTVVEFKPNFIVKTKQFLNGDTLKWQLSKIEYFYDSLIIKEIYHNHMTSENNAFVDGEYQYFYDKNNRLKFKYYIESTSGDTTKSCYEYFNNNRDYNELVYDFKRRLKSGMPHGDIIEEDDLTKERIWLYNETITHFYDDSNNLIQLYQPIIDKDFIVQNKYTYKYQGNKLIEENSYLNDTVLYWTEKYEYKPDEIIMTHNNIKEKNNKWIIPYYFEISKLDKYGNVIEIEEIDNNKKLMNRFLNSYDLKNRLIKMECFDNQNNLKVCHKLQYELLGQTIPQN
jgi:hypothetical protein